MLDHLKESAGIEELLALARRGEGDAENLLFERIHARILALAKRKVWDPEAARDIAQETIQTALEKYRQSEFPYGFMPWLFVILRNKIGNYLKHRRVESIRLDSGPSIHSREWDTVGVSTEGELAAMDLARSLESALRRASPECRRIFQLLLEGATRSEIRAAFGAEPIGTIDSRICRCRARLLAHLESAERGKRE